MTEQRRRHNAPAGRRELRTVIKHTAQEYAIADSQARALGITRARLYVQALAGGSARAAVELQAITDDLYGARNLMARTAANLNQLARVANATGEIPGELPAAAAAVERAAGRIAEVLDRLEQGTLR